MFFLKIFQIQFVAISDTVVWKVTIEIFGATYSLADDPSVC